MTIQLGSPLATEQDESLKSTKKSSPSLNLRVCNDQRSSFPSWALELKKKGLRGQTPNELPKIFATLRFKRVIRAT